MVQTRQQYWSFQGVNKEDVETRKPQTRGLRTSCQLNTERGGELPEIKQCRHKMGIGKEII